MTDIENEDLQELLTYFSKNTYRTKDADVTAQSIMQKCILLADLDYTHSVINNIAGELSGHYPSHLIILENEKSNNATGTSPALPLTTETIYESSFDSARLKELIKPARFARCRSRFPLPVILYKGRYICRSSTLSGGPEIYGRSSVSYFFDDNESVEQLDEASGGGDTVVTDWPLFDKVRSQDIKLLKALNVGNIIDFMVENKKVKYGVNVTSSEKIDKVKRYSDFTIISLPYPGCEFFREFRDNNYDVEGLVFDWSQAHVDAQIRVPDDAISNQLPIHWERYQQWDLPKLTQNYLKLILKYLNESSNGMLIHCISGWDRTPLFVSLLRLSLWADGMIHKSLNTHQMLYFTIAYDWLLFGHDLQDRATKGEEIFFFCFFFLKYITDDEFSVNSNHARQRHSLLSNDSNLSLDNTGDDNESMAPVSLGSSSMNVSSANSSNQSNGNSKGGDPPIFIHCSSIDSPNDPDSIEIINFTPDSSPQKNPLSSHSPLPRNRTSPIEVPIPRSSRQRSKSTSSCGSWQIVSETGSLQGSTASHLNASTPTPPKRPGFLGLTCLQPRYVECIADAMRDTNSADSEDDLFALSRPTRNEQLSAVRLLFYQIYSRTEIGFRMKGNSDSWGLGQIVGNFAEKVKVMSLRQVST